MGKKCSIYGCGGSVKGYGWCNKHLLRWHRHGNPLGGRTPSGDLKDWLLKHVTYEGDECLIWPFARDNKEEGYGRMWWNGHHARAHRIMCELAHGKPPSRKHEAAHDCGRGRFGCVNPRHLGWKTAKQNSGDRILHGTQVRGSTHKLAKLTEGDIPEILGKLSAGESYNAIARGLGVSAAAIRSIAKGESWAWITGINNEVSTRLRPNQGDYGNG
jgi:hypothetical protein